MPRFDYQNKAILWKNNFVVLATMVWGRGLVAHVGGMKSTYEIPVGELKGKEHCGVCEQVILKLALKK
jgi:hypothetical protein